MYNPLEIPLVLRWFSGVTPPRWHPGYKIMQASNSFAILGETLWKCVLVALEL